MSAPPPPPPPQSASLSSNSPSHSRTVTAVSAPRRSSAAPELHPAVSPAKNQQPRRKESAASAYDPSRSGRFSIATIARTKSSSLLSSLALRSKPSGKSLGADFQARHTKQAASSSTHTSAKASLNNADPFSSHSSRDTHSSSSSIEAADFSQQPVIQSTPRPPSRDTAKLANNPSGQESSRSQQPSGPPGTGSSNNKMHQTSSRLLRMTDEERPFTRDFEDLFSTLMVSLPLSHHRVRFQRIEHTFTSEEAINNLWSLKFSQSNRMPDPKDTTRIVTTTTTTTFSMAKEMARSVCQRFMDARFIETAESRSVPIFALKGGVWQLTPKGMHVLTRFCQRNGINQRHVLDVLESPRNAMQLVILERDVTTDKLSHDRATMEVIFRRFAGRDGPNVKSGSTNSDSDSIHDYYNGLVGVRMHKERKINDRVVQNTFTGRAAVDWLLDCCTTVDRREAHEVAELFVQHGFIWPALEDKQYAQQTSASGRFQPTKYSIYGLTEKGQIVAGWISRESSPVGESREPKSLLQRSDGRAPPRETNNNRLLVIVNDAALRLLFREYLRDTHCEENLAFYMDVCEFTKNYDNSERTKQFQRLDAIRECLAAAYGLYNAFLAPGSPCELNIDHNLRNSLAARMTRAVGEDETMLASLQEVVALFKEAQTSVFKLMSSDSVPKFLKEPKYANVLREHNFDHGMPSLMPQGPVVPERSQSRVTRDPREIIRSRQAMPPPPTPMTPDFHNASRSASDASSNSLSNSHSRSTSRSPGARSRVTQTTQSSVDAAATKISTMHISADDGDGGELAAAVEGAGKA